MVWFSEVKTTTYSVPRAIFVRQQGKEDSLIYNQNEAPPVGVKNAGMPAPPAL
jgi:hypothetical protein